MNTIEIGKIIVPKKFTMPRSEKMDSVRAYVEEHGTLDKPVVLQGDLLIDGYVRYLIAKEYGMEYVPCMQTFELNESNVTPRYIIGRFESTSKEYTWRLPNKVHVEAGDLVLVDSRFAKKNRAVVRVVKVFESDDKELYKHKNVIKKLKNKSKK